MINRYKKSDTQLRGPQGRSPQVTSFAKLRTLRGPKLSQLTTNILQLTTILFFCTSAGLHAQCWPEGFTHDTRPQQMWLSCEATQNPHPDRGQGLWLQYDLGYVYNLTNTIIWNYNEPGFLELGTTRLAVDYSMDGQDWTSWGELDLQLATGRRDYSGEEGPDFNGASARYVLFTILEVGTGQLDCAGLSEVRFNLGGSVSTEEPALASALKVFPNPAEDVVQLRLAEAQLQLVELYDQQGRLLQRHEPSSQELQLNVQSLPAGIYLLKVMDAEQGVYQERLVVL